jgi:hypothetical protein
MAWQTLLTGIHGHTKGYGKQMAKPTIVGCSIPLICREHYKCQVQRVKDLKEHGNQVFAISEVQFREIEMPLLERLLGNSSFCSCANRFT